MVRVTLSFLGGLVAGYLGCYVVFRIILAFMFDTTAAAEAAGRRGISVQEYEAWRAGVEARVAGLTLAGGLLCAAAWGVKAAVSPRPGADARRGRSDATTPQQNAGLTPEEFRRVFFSCQGVRLAEKSAAYLQGFLVSRLTDTAPDLAVKLDQFGDERMAALRDDLLARQAKLG
jgi:hypothetical protein